MSGFVIESEEELAARQTGDYADGDGQPKLLPEDDYVARVESIEVLPNRTSDFNRTPHDEWKARFDILSFIDGSPLVYDDNSAPDPTKDVRLTTFFDPTKRGMVPQPSKTRKFITAAMGVGVSERIELDNPVTELIGKRVVITTAHKVDRKGIKRDRIVDFSRVRRARASAETNTSSVSSTVKVDSVTMERSDADVEAAAEAKLAAPRKVFDDDLKF